MTLAARACLLAALVSGCSDSADDVGDAGDGDASTGGDTECQVYRDDDGDGVGSDVGLRATCGAEPPDGYAAEGGDCDDDDPEVFDTYYMDYDRDGIGQREMTVCAGDEAPSYASPSDTDCDDGSVYIHSEAAEPFDDGQDYDCDGEEKPACALLDEHDPDSPGRPLDAECLGADLYVAEVFRCYDVGCGDRYAFTVGNRGTVELTDDVEVGFRTPEELTMLRYVTLLTEDIPSGGRSAPIRMPSFEPGTVLIEVGADGTDCTIGNNSTDVEVEDVPCRD